MSRNQVYQFLKQNDGKYTYDELKEKLEKEKINIDMNNLLYILGKLADEDSIIEDTNENMEVVVSFNHDKNSDKVGIKE